MIEQQGRVIQLSGNEAEVRIGVSAGCSLCEQGKGCGAGIFAQLLRRKPSVVRVRNVIGAQPGQLVTLGIPEKVFLSMLSRLYLLPLASALAGAAIGHHLAGKLPVSAGMIDLISLLGSMVFFAAALFVCRQGGPKIAHGFIAMNRAPDRQSNSAGCQSKEIDVNGI